MKKFLDQDFLLATETAMRLFHEYGAGMPIIDYHCHLSPKDIVEDRVFTSITEAWLEGDHYKWRAMRNNGVDEKYITGDADGREKFKKWAETVPYTLRNPLYHWTHLELQRYFGITELLSGENADEIFDKANRKLASLSTQTILRKFSVQVVCTTDDPVDNLEFHRSWNKSKKELILVPTFRADKVLLTEEEGWNDYVDRLGDVSGQNMDSFNDLMEALEKRHGYFHHAGCRLSDNGLEYLFTEDMDLEGVRKIFRRLRSGLKITPKEHDIFRSAVLYELAKLNHSRGWVQQYHLGALRKVNTRMSFRLGNDAGYDSISDVPQAARLAWFLDRLDQNEELAKTIIYNLNPADNAVFSSMTGNFSGSIPGKIQLGSAWWFLDQKEGIEEHLNTLSAMGLLSRFVGMLTDSRSFLSFPRHEYFRRILCNLIGKDVEAGLIPENEAMLERLVRDICYFNARNYFDFFLSD